MLDERRKRVAFTTLIRQEERRSLSMTNVETNKIVIEEKETYLSKYNHQIHEMEAIKERSRLTAISAHPWNRSE